MPLHCLWVKSNNRTRGQFECDVTWFCFYFESVHLHLERGCCSIVCWRGWVGVKIGRSRSNGWKNFGRRWTWG